MNKDEPKYLGSWRGRVIKAIVIDKAKTFKDLQDITGLHQKSLRRAIAELRTSEIITGTKPPKGVTQYKVVVPSIIEEYTAYYHSLNQHPHLKPVLVCTAITEKLKQSIAKWKEYKHLDIDLESKHFFLTDRFLDEFSKDLIDLHAHQELYVVNPFVDNIHISQTLLDATKKGVQTTLITRPPKDIDETRAEFHTHLIDAGVQLYYHNTVHAKIIVVDGAAAIVSSINFISTASAGQSWEAGLVTLDLGVIDQIRSRVLDLRDQSTHQSSE